MSKKIKRYFILGAVSVTVTQSQVFNWVKLANENGISTDCISITPNKLDKRKVSEIETSFSGNFIQVISKRILYDEIILAIILLKFYLKNIKKYDKIIFQTRMPSIGLTFFLLKGLPGAKFIFESRAAWIEEKVHVLGGGKMNLKMRIKKYISEKSEKIMITKSDRVLSVSNALKDYYINKYHLNNEDCIYVFPGAADSHLFYYNETLRSQIREKLLLNHKDLLVVYSGRLEQKWEIPDKIFSFFEHLHTRDNNFKLLLVTPDFELAQKHIDNFKFKDKVLVRKGKLKDVNEFLNASDVALLLREDVLMNNVASPTKFAEYLMAGLPVIISAGIHDFAKIIENSQFGVVVDGLDKMSNMEYNILLKSLDFNKNEISQWGTNHLSKESYLDQYIGFLRNV